MLGREGVPLPLSIHEGNLNFRLCACNKDWTAFCVQEQLLSTSLCYCFPITEVLVQAIGTLVVLKPKAESALSIGWWWKAQSHSQWCHGRWQVVSMHASLLLIFFFKREGKERGNWKFIFVCYKNMPKLTTVSAFVR